MKHRFKENVIVVENESSGDSSGDEFSFLSYNDLYGSLELSKEVHATTIDSSESHITFSPNPPSIGLPVCSTPLRDAPLALNMLEGLDEYEESEICDRSFDCDLYFEPDEIELFDGSDFSTRDFHKNFKELANKHSLSGIAQKDLLKFFCKFLPDPNNVFTTMPIDQLPSTTKFTDQESTFISVRLLPQIKKILARNLSHIKNSWSSNCPLNFGSLRINEKVIYLNMNIDGVALFKSRNFSIGPVWIQIFNLPEKLRGKFQNLALLGLWHGKSKPNWNFFNKKVCTEIELFVRGKAFIDNLGLCSFKFQYLICDMPAMASLCQVQQFNGYYGCPYCYIRGYHENRRMLYSVTKSYCLRQNEQYEENAKNGKFGVKDISPFHEFFPIPWSVPIDSMHQVFLGVAKILTIALITKLKSMKDSFDNKLDKCMVPYESIHKPKSVKELKLWKASDYKIFFFHLGPILLNNSYFCGDRLFVENFMRLSLAIRLLSEFNVPEELVNYAEKQIEIFFRNFLTLFSVESQSFNFHAVRHLPEQVKMLGPLWLHSAFSYESANHMLIRTVKGSIKQPDKIVYNFLTSQFCEQNSSDCKTINTELYTKLSAECLHFATVNDLNSFRGRHFKNFLFTSESFTYKKSNLSNSFAQLSSGEFVKIEFFAKNPNQALVVIVRLLKNKKLKMFFEDLDDKLVYLYRLSDPSDLTIKAVEDLKWKCVVYEEKERIFLVSVMREGFEHN